MIGPALHDFDARLQIVVALCDQFRYVVSFCVHIHVSDVETCWQTYRRHCPVTMDKAEK